MNGSGSTENSREQLPAARQAIEAALNFHKAGKLREAEELCRRVLRADPVNGDALHLCGVIAHQSGDSQAAAELIGRAIVAQPANPLFFNNRGLALAAQSRFSEAEADYRRALALNPDFARAHNNLGIVLKEMGRLHEAEVCHAQALALRPDYAQAHYALGVVAQELGRPGQAEHAFRTALALKPDYPAAQNALGLVFKALGRPGDAEQCFRQALALNPELAEAHCNLGGLLRELRRTREAAASLRTAIALKPSLAQAHNNLGLVQRDMGQLQQAEQSYLESLAINPEQAETFNNLGALQQETLRLDDAQGSYRRALELNPAFDLAAVNHALLLLMRGDYGTGLPLYERRLQCLDSWNAAGYHVILPMLSRLPRWQGEEVSGSRLLVWTEQGLGDSLMMMRYLKPTRDRGFSRLTVCCEPELARLMQVVAGVDDVIAKAGPLRVQDFDCHCPMMSLPFAHGTRPGTIPAEVPYLRVPPAIARKWARNFESDDIGGARLLRIGLVWAGGRGNPGDEARSIPLSAFSELFGNERLLVVSLQKGRAAGDAPASRWNIRDWMDECQDLLETAALVEQLDLVVSIDTAVAHLAGALGKPVWLLNRLQSDWRWMLDREDSPWYPTMKIFRQTDRNSWDEVIGAMASRLRKQRGI